jgi:hypothetical protein
MSDYDEAVKKGAIYVPGYNPPGGTMAAEQKRRQDAERLKKSSGGGGGGFGGGGGSGTGGGCFVATAAFGDFDAPEVVFLRAFRDKSLSRTVLGRCFIQVYYTISPPLAEVIAKSQWLRRFVRNWFLQPLVFLLRDRRS